MKPQGDNIFLVVFLICRNNVSRAVAYQNIKGAHICGFT
jgi:hypothetical protein